MAAAVLPVLLATLTPAPEAAEAAARTPWWCVTCGSAGVADFALNLVLLAPLGAVLAMAGWGALRTAAAAATLAVAIELLQGTIIRGRDAALGDVVANTVGGVAGWLVARHWGAITHPHPRTAASVAAALIGLGTATGVAATRLLVPAMSRAEFTRVRFRPPAAGRPTFAGEVISYQLNGVAYRDRDVPDSLPATTVHVVAVFTWRASGDGTATIVRVDGARGDAVMSLDVRDHLLRADAYSSASDQGLRSPPVAVPLPSPLRTGDTVTVHYAWQGDRVALTATAGRRRSQLNERFRPWHGWVLLNPFTSAMRFDGRASTWTALWIGAWVAMIGWYLRTATRKRGGVR